MKYVSWTGGFDSNYIVIKNVLEGKIVQPIYFLLEKSRIPGFQSIERFSGDEKATLKYLKYRDNVQLKSIEYFTSKYSKNILKPIILNREEYYSENKNEIENLKKELYDFEEENKNHYLKRDGLIYTKINSNRRNHTIKNSDNKTLILGKLGGWAYSYPELETLLKYYFPVFPKKEEWELMNWWHESHLFPLIHLSNKMNVEIETGFHDKSFWVLGPMKKWLGINENMKISDSRYKSLQNLVFPLYKKTKLDMAKDLIEINSDLFIDIVDNGASCSSISDNKKRNSNYCKECDSCRALEFNKIFLMRNLQKIYKNRERKLI